MFIKPDWPQSNGIVAISTTRAGGVSQAPFTSLNLGDHVGDKSEAVTKNRELLAEAINLKPQNIQWLQQCHGSQVVLAGGAKTPKADAVISRTKGLACAILTADCLPILMSNSQGTEVAAIHGGWRPLAMGIIANTLAAMHSKPSEINAWLGPCISQSHYEVGEEVKKAFCQEMPEASSAFKHHAGGKYLACLHTLANKQLQSLGVSQQAISAYSGCSYGEPDKFYSYRRDGQTGRMASVIAIAN